MSRTTAPDRMRRVLAIVPWILENPGETVETVARRFGLSKNAVLDDLNVVFMVGLPPYSPDALVDVEIDDEGRVTIHLADFFRRPLRLTTGQALALLASSEGLLSIPGTERDGPLGRGLEKVARSLGAGAGRPLEVHLGDAVADTLLQLRSAVAEELEVRIEYYSFGRDSHSTRTIAPWRVFADSGAWYVHAWCTSADGERIFRLDRIESIVVDTSNGGRSRRPVDGEQSAGTFHPRPSDPRIRLQLATEAAWVVDTYPCEDVESNDDGTLEATLVVTAERWLVRLLIRLGDSAEIVEIAEGFDCGTLVQQSASAMRDRYRRQPKVLGAV